MRAKATTVGGGVVFYDGECVICTRLVLRFEGVLGRRGFSFMPLQAEWARERLGLRAGEPLLEMRVLAEDGVVRGGANAVVFLARRIWWARGLGLVWRVPGGQRLLEGMYRCIAQRRSCVDGSCAVAKNSETGVLPTEHTDGHGCGGRVISESEGAPTKDTKGHEWGAERISGWVGVLPLVVLPAGAVVLGRQLPGWGYMWAVAFAIFCGCKGLTFAVSGARGGAGGWRKVGYLMGWPGMDADAFLGGVATKRVSFAEVAFAGAKLLFGCALLFFVARRFENDLAAGWVGMVGIIFVLHFGLFDLLALAWRAAGVDARRLMVAPICAVSLGEFWGRRWNAAFNRLVVDHVFRPLVRRVGAPLATMASFAVSGLVHELVISVPARGGYGLPTAFFLLQGAGMLAEHSRAGRRLGLGRGARGWLFAMAVTAGPAFFLFHPAFVRNVFLPFMEVVGAL